MATKRSLKGKRALVTCGPTWVAIDDVRVISNHSTGEQGHLIAGHLIKEGAKVTLLEGPVTHIVKLKAARIIKFQFFDELTTLLQEEVKENYDMIVHAAAVSDYAPNQPYKSKLSSAFSNLKIDLIPTPKLINAIKKTSPGSFLVGFKLESNANEEFLRVKVGHLMRAANCDLVVANSSSKNNYQGLIFDRDKNVVAKTSTRQGTAKALVAAIKERL